MTTEAKEKSIVFLPVHAKLTYSFCFSLFKLAELAIEIALLEFFGVPEEGGCLAGFISPIQTL